MLLLTNNKASSQIHWYTYQQAMTSWLDVLRTLQLQQSPTQLFHSQPATIKSSIIFLYKPKQYKNIYIYRVNTSSRSLHYVDILYVCMMLSLLQCPMATCFHSLQSHTIFHTSLEFFYLWWNYKYIFYQPIQASFPSIFSPRYNSSNFPFQI